MATRSAIGIKHGDVIKAVYCHWDGYLEHNGLILVEHYQDSVKVNQLISLGDLSILGPEIGVEHPFSSIGVDNWDESYEQMCTFYGRDRGETDTGFETFQNQDQFVESMDHRGCEYLYLYDRGQWFYSTGGHFAKLELDVIMKLLSTEESL